MVKERKSVTNRIVTKEDVERILDHIHRAECRGSISISRAEQYTAFTVFGAFTGQRSMATMMKLSVGQVREALRATNPCSASSGSLSLTGADTARLAVGTHTLKIDWLSDNAYGPTQSVMTFTVTSPTPTATATPFPTAPVPTLTPTIIRTG